MKLETTKRLERTQYAAALAVTGAWRGSSRQRLLEELGWESLYTRNFNPFNAPRFRHGFNCLSICTWLDITSVDSKYLCELPLYGTSDENKVDIVLSIYVLL